MNVVCQAQFWQHRSCGTFETNLHCILCRILVIGISSDHMWLSSHGCKAWPLRTACPLSCSTKSGSNYQISNKLEPFKHQSVFSMASSSVVKRRLPWEVKAQINKQEGETRPKRGVVASRPSPNLGRKQNKRTRNTDDIHISSLSIAPSVSERSSKSQSRPRKGLHPTGKVSITTAVDHPQSQSPQPAVPTHIQSHTEMGALRPVMQSVEQTEQMRSPLSAQRLQAAQGGDTTQPTPKKARRGVSSSIIQSPVHLSSSPSRKGQEGVGRACCPQRPQPKLASRRTTPDLGAFQMNFGDESDSDSAPIPTAASVGAPLTRESTPPPAASASSAGDRPQACARTPDSKRVSLLSLLSANKGSSPTAPPAAAQKPSLLGRLGLK